MNDKDKGVLIKVHDYLGELIRDNLVEDTPKASDLADDVWDILHKENVVSNMTFGQAIEAMSNAKKVARLGWRDDEFVRVEELLTFEDGILHMNEDNKVPLISSMCCVYHWCEKESKEPLFRAGWTPSFEDIIAVDWKIVE
jgi:hypothetical protein